MSERLYQMLLLLYPHRFRQSYGEEALQLFRDRIGDETGLLRRVGLWFDLLLDLAAIHVRGYHEVSVVQAISSARGSVNGIPAFSSLEEDTLELRFVFWGGVLSLIVCGAVLAALGSGGHLPYQMSSSNAVYSEQKVTPRIALTYEPAHPVAGETVRLSAVVSAAHGEPMPTGNVHFLYGWAVLAQGTLVNGTATAEATLPEGKSLPLNAIYTGDLRYVSANTFVRDR